MAAREREAGLFDEALKGSFVTARLVDELRGQIQSGSLKHGELIKPVRELMKQYGISYNSVRKALNQLADEGYVALEQGRGTFVKGAKVPRGPVLNQLKHKEILGDHIVANEAIEESQLDAGAGGDLIDSVSLGDESGVEVPPEWRDEEPEENQLPVSTPQAGMGTTAVEVLVTGATGLDSAGWLPRAFRAFLSGALSSSLPVILTPGGASAGWTPRTGCRGVVFWGLAPAEGALRGIGSTGIACVAVGCSPAGAFSSVLPDGFGGAHVLTRRLCGLGHREVAVLWSQTGQEVRGAPAVGSLSHEAVRGCQVALEEAGLTLRPSHRLGLAPEADWLADRLLALTPRPTAFLVTEQALAERVIGQLKVRGVMVPRAFSVVCFGDSDEANALDISSVRIDGAQVGGSVLNRLRELMAGAPGERLRIRIPVGFHEGSTVGPI